MRHTRAGRARHLRVALLGVVVAFQTVSAFAVGEPTPTALDPMSGATRRSVTVTQISATYDRALNSPPQSTMSLTDNTNAAVAGTVVMTNGNKTIIFRPSALLSESLSPYATHVHAVPSAAGDPATTEWSFTIDDTPPPPPAITTPAEGAMFRATTVTLTGTAAPNAPVGVQEGGSSIGTTTANANGGWALNRTFAEGTHAITATTDDPAGNTSAPTAPRNFTIDLTAPGAPAITLPLEGDQLSSATVTVQGTAEANSFVALKEGGNTLASGPADASGNWSIVGSFADGAHTITATTTDPAGNISPASASRSFSIVTGPPVLLTTSPADHTFTSSATTVAATYNKNITGSSALDVRDRNGALLTGTTSVNGPTITFTAAGPLQAGSSPFEATTHGVDAASNSSGISTFHFGIGATPVIQQPAAAALLNTATVSIGGTAPANTTVTVREAGAQIATAAADGTGAWSVQHAFADGTHSIDAFATDTAADVTAMSAARSFTVDTTPPGAPAITAPGDGVLITTASVSISGTAEAASTVTLSEGATTLGNTTTQPNGTWSLTRSFADGAHTVIARATDAAGNIGAATSRTFNVDTAPPAAPSITAPFEDQYFTTQSVTISGRSEANATVRVRDGVTQIASTPADSGGRWSVDLLIGEGVHSVTATATDSAGNTSVPSTVRKFTIRVSPPLAPLISFPQNGTWLNHDSMFFSGTGEATTSIVLKEGTTEVGRTIVNDQGNWVLFFTVPDGAHTVTITAVDRAGRASPSLTRTFTADTVAPSISFTTVDQTLFLPGTTQIDGGAQDDRSVVAVNVDFVQPTGAIAKTVAATLDEIGKLSATWSAAPSGLLPGVYTVRARAYDKAGNVSATKMIMVISLG